MPTTSSVPADSAAQKIQLTKSSASIRIGELGSPALADEAAGQPQLDPAVDDPDREGLDGIGCRWDHGLAGADVETAAVPGADQHAVARVEARLAQREVAVTAVVLDCEELALMTDEHDGRAVDLDRDQLAVTQLI